MASIILLLFAFAGSGYILGSMARRDEQIPVKYKVVMAGYGLILLLVLVSGGWLFVIGYAALGAGAWYVGYHLTKSDDVDNAPHHGLRRSVFMDVVDDGHDDGDDDMDAVNASAADDARRSLRS